MCFCSVLSAHTGRPSWFYYSWGRVSVRTVKKEVNYSYTLDDCNCHGNAGCTKLVGEKSFGHLQLVGSLWLARGGESGYREHTQAVCVPTARLELLPGRCIEHTCTACIAKHCNPAYSIIGAQRSSIISVELSSEQNHKCSHRE